MPVPGDFLSHRLDHLNPAVAVTTDGNLLKKTIMAKKHNVSSLLLPGI